MRILWVSNAPWCGSGYGQQTDLFTRRFLAAGHEVAIGANHGLQERATNYHGIQVFPVGGHQDAIQTFAKHFKSDVNILLYDSWTMNPNQWPEIHMAMWAPVDHWPIPAISAAVLKHERVRPVAMSRFGESWMNRLQVDPLYVPHGVETDVFQPEPGSQAEIRKMLEIPEEAFVVGMVAGNYGWIPDLSRKSFPQAFDAVGRLMKKHDDVYFYVHSRMDGGTRGNDLKMLAFMMEIPSDRFRAPQSHWWHLGVMDSGFVAGVYNSLDVLLNPSMGEGFGVPIIEAQACGVPVIASDHSAMSELAHAGWLVQGDRYYHENQQAFAFMPHVGSITEALERSYANRDNQELKEKARRFGLTYDADRVMEKYWTPVLDELAKPAEVKPFPKNGGGPNRAQRRAAARRK